MYLFRRYILAINIVTFVIRGYDKHIARSNGVRVKTNKRGRIDAKQRISEKHLLRTCMLGGWAGAYLAMITWRHKTIKRSFLWKFYVIVGVWLCIIGYLLFAYT